jgi:DNA-binding NarL/FixJ family response regulator
MKLILNNLPYIDAIHEAGDGKECLTYFKEGGKADIVFMDIEMPEMNGIDTTEQVLKIQPGTNIIGLSMYADEDYYTRMIEAGAKGFILKNSGIKEVEEAIQHVCSGNNYFAQEILAGFIKSITRKKEPEKTGKLSEREEEVLYLICKGLSNQEIADNLHISKRTVDKHRENLLLKTESKNTAGLVMYAIKNGVVEV